LIFPDQLKYAYELAKEFPEQPFVIDHLAKPLIKDQVIDEWKKDMEAIAACENVYCKISGMVTEADWNNWKETDFTAYLDVVTNAFGINRVMFGSDWPVCLVAGGYEKMLSIVQNYFAAFSIREQEKFFGQNAIEFYKL
jgi:L-fuconolactonase